MLCDSDSLSLRYLLFPNVAFADEVFTYLLIACHWFILLNYLWAPNVAIKICICESNIFIEHVFCFYVNSTTNVFLNATKRLEFGNTKLAIEAGRVFK